MNDPAAPLNLVSSLGGLLAIGAGVLVVRFAERGWVIWPLLALTACVTAMVAWPTVAGSFWYAVPNGVLAIGVVVLWDHHLGARHGRPGRIALLLAAWQIRRGKAGQRRPDGRPMRTIADLRAEYGQNVLDDAARDPLLERVLSIYEEHLTELIRRPDGTIDLLLVTAFANHYLDSLSDPGRHRPTEPPYAGYTHHMLALAAMCRLASRLPTISITTVPDRQPTNT